MEDEEGFQEKERYIEKKVESIYSGELNSETIRDKPILEPVAEMNQSFTNTQKILNKSDWEYGQVKKEIEDMLRVMPKYSQTMIVSVVQKLIMHADQSTFLGKRQQEILKKGMQDMIKIAQEQPVLEKVDKDRSEHPEEDFDFAQKEPEGEFKEEQDEPGFVPIDEDSEENLA